MAKRACRGTTRRGTPCTVSPLTAAGAAKLGLPEQDQDWCAAHHPDLPASARFGSRAQATEAGKQGGRPRLPRVVDVIKERIEAEADEVVDALMDALHATEGIAIAVKGGGATLVETPDHKTRIAAARELLDRGYGRPKQQTELTGADGGPVEIVPVAIDRDAAAAVAGILSGTGAVRPAQEDG